jgi:ABC-2 type transport system ATP-binding protein
MNGEVVLRTDGLAKRFGEVRAVERVDLEVRRGEVFGFLGPNGAGKTTSIGMMLGLLHPSAGQVEVFGEAVTPNRTAALRRVGALVGAPGLYPYLSGRDNLSLVARISPGIGTARVDEVLELVGLTEAAHRKAVGYSTGMKQRLGLAVALLHRPDLLILDEPTNGLDPAGMRDVREILRGLAENGTAVFLSSHLLHEVEQVCDRVAVLNKGKVVARGSVADLLGGESVVKIRVADPAEAAQLLRQLPAVKGVDVNGHGLVVRGISSEAVVAHLTAHGVVPGEVSSGHGDLESVFLALTES